MFIIIFWTSLSFGLTPYEKHNAFLDHKKEQAQYEAQREESFKEYKKDSGSYQKRQENILNQRLKVLSKLRNSQSESLKQERLERAWQKKNKKWISDQLISKRVYLRKRKGLRKQEVSYPIDEFDF